MFLNACAVGPSFDKPNIAHDKDWIEGQLNTDEVISKWWTVFNDPLLESLINEAAKTNYDVRIAAARVREASAARGIAVANGLPQLNSLGSFERRSASENAAGGLGGLAKAGMATLEQDVYNSGFDATWEIDIFGGSRAEADAAKARIVAAVNNSRDVLVAVFAEVAHNYMELRGNQKRLQII